jgi:hypothetical protein
MEPVVVPVFRNKFTALDFGGTFTGAGFVSRNYREPVL